jgi:hypothetical protein
LITLLCSTLEMSKLILDHIVDSSFLLHPLDIPSVNSIMVPHTLSKAVEQYL